MSIRISPEQCRAARAWLGWSQTDLAERSSVGLTAIKNFEKGARKTVPAIRGQLQRTFETAGMGFSENGISFIKPGERGAAPASGGDAG
jgi:ribosome-binding protein aMBF1 (putative translation factor)